MCVFNHIHFRTDLSFELFMHFVYEAAGPYGVSYTRFQVCLVEYKAL